MKVFEEVRFQFIWREGNSVVYLLARSCDVSDVNIRIIDVPNQHVNALVLKYFSCISLDWVPNSRLLTALFITKKESTTFTKYKKNNFFFLVSLVANSFIGFYDDGGMMMGNGFAWVLQRLWMWYGVKSLKGFNMIRNYFKSLNTDGGTSNS